jgi:hypothetical protein
VEQRLVVAPNTVDQFTLVFLTKSTSAVFEINWVTTTVHHDKSSSSLEYTSALYPILVNATLSTLARTWWSSSDDDDDNDNDNDSGMWSMGIDKSTPVDTDHGQVDTKDDDDDGVNDTDRGQVDTKDDDADDDDIRYVMLAMPLTLPSVPLGSAKCKFATLPIIRLYFATLVAQLRDERIDMAFAGVVNTFYRGRANHILNSDAAIMGEIVTLLSPFQRETLPRFIVLLHVRTERGSRKPYLKRLKTMKTKLKKLSPTLTTTERNDLAVLATDYYFLVTDTESHAFRLQVHARPILIDTVLASVSILDPYDTYREKEYDHVLSTIATHVTAEWGIQGVVIAPTFDHVSFQPQYTLTCGFHAIAIVNLVIRALSVSDDDTIAIADILQTTTLAQYNVLKERMFITLDDVITTATTGIDRLADVVLLSYDSRLALAETFATTTLTRR